MLVCPHGGRVPQGTYPPSQVPTPLPVQGTYPPVQVRMGGEGTPRYLPTHPRYLPPPSRLGGGRGGGTPRYLPPIQVRMGRGGGTPRYLPPPHPRYLPSPPDRTAYGVLYTLRSVCLLRSRRRTFLFEYNFDKVFCIRDIDISWLSRCSTSGNS